MPKSKIVSSIIALVSGLCVVVFTIAYFSINGKHNREGYTFEGDFFNGTETLIGMENPKVMFNDSKNKQIPSVLQPGHLVTQDVWFKDNTWTTYEPD